VRWLVPLAFVACSVGPPGPSLDVDQELAHITALVALGPRPADSDAARSAASYIRTALVSIPLETTPVGDVELPAIDVLGTTFRQAHRVHVDDPDLVARFGPSPNRSTARPRLGDAPLRAGESRPSDGSTGKALLFMAHYDTMPSCPGAIDDGASVAVLIELARELHAHPPAQPVMIAFFPTSTFSAITSFLHQL